MCDISVPDELLLVCDNRKNIIAKSDNEQDHTPYKVQHHSVQGQYLFINLENTKVVLLE